MAMHPLLDLLSRDQENLRSYRNGSISLEDMNKANTQISERFLAYVDASGFPFKDEADEKVYKAAVVLGLHLFNSNNDQVRFFQKYIEKAPDEQVEPWAKAYFIDKIRINAGQKQLYGTQFKATKDGSIESLPIEDEENVNKRRAELGMKTIEEYKKFAAGN